jgi:Uma2 family endonuclease
MTAQQRIAAATSAPVRLNATDFRLLAESGAFARYARTELIEGEIWAVNSIWRWHSRVNAQFIIEIDRALTAAGHALTVYGPGSVALSDDSVPEPDISVCLPESSAREPISLAAVRIAVELADTTRDMDLGRKAQLYARHGIPEYWVADRETQQLVQHTQPAENGYARIIKIAFGDPLVSETLGGVTVATASLLD